MGLDNVIKLGLALTIAAALTGRLPRITNEIRHGERKLFCVNRQV